MTIDYLEIGPTPADETCQQVGTPEYDHDMARRECRQFINAIKRTCGEPPAGAALVVKSNPHDFGTYLEVAVKFDSDNEKAARYAYRVESKAPTQWSDLDRVVLGLPLD